MAHATPFIFETFGLGIWSGTPPQMRRLHSHTEVEFNLVTRGSLRYRFAGEPVELKAGALYVFGGITPHELEHVEAGAEYICLTVPLPAFIRWRLPPTGDKVIDVGEACGFTSHCSFYAAFKRLTGLTPTTYLGKNCYRSPLV